MIVRFYNDDDDDDATRLDRLSNSSSRPSQGHDSADLGVAMGLESLDSGARDLSGHFG